jgi:hypothetical protein
VPGDLQPSTDSPPTPTTCGSGLARESGGSANTATNSATAFAASLKLDISHRGWAVPGDLQPSTDSPPTPITCGSGLAREVAGTAYAALNEINA